MRLVVACTMGAMCVAACKGPAPDTSVGATQALGVQTIPAAAVAPDLGRIGGSSLAGADIVVTVDGKRYSFGKHCKGYAGGADGLAAGGAVMKPRRPQQIWITGCDESTGHFHVVLDHGPTEGVATPSLFSITLPGVAPQDVRSGASVRLARVQADRIYGSFDVLVRPGGGGAPVISHGTFDVPRRPDDTSARP
jgi:hypothetical protein